MQNFIRSKTCLFKLYQGGGLLKKLFFVSMFLSILLEVFCRSVISLLLLIVFIIFIIVQDTLHAGGRLAAIENHTLGFLILFKVLVAVLLFVLLTVKVLIHMCEYTFSLYYRILIQGDKTHPLIVLLYAQLLL